MCMKKVNCICCGKKTNYGIPYSICDSCKEIITKFNDTKTNYENDLMSIRNVTPISKFDSGLDDVDLSLDIIADNVFEIEKKLEWIKNNLLNIQQEVKSKIVQPEK